MSVNVESVFGRERENLALDVASALDFTSKVDIKSIVYEPLKTWPAWAMGVFAPEETYAIPVDIGNHQVGDPFFASRYNPHDPDTLNFHRGLLAKRMHDMYGSGDLEQVERIMTVGRALAEFSHRVGPHLKRSHFAELMPDFPSVNFKRDIGNQFNVRIGDDVSVPVGNVRNVLSFNPGLAGAEQVSTLAGVATRYDHVAAGIGAGYTARWVELCIEEMRRAGRQLPAGSSHEDIATLLETAYDECYDTMILDATRNVPTRDSRTAVQVAATALKENGFLVVRALDMPVDPDRASMDGLREQIINLHRFSELTMPAFSGTVGEYVVPRVRGVLHAMPASYAVYRRL